MRLDELALDAVECRVKLMKDNAKAAKDRARQLRAQAGISAERLDMQKSRAALTQAQRSAVTSTIQSYRRCRERLTVGRSSALRPRNWPILWTVLAPSWRVTEFL